MARLQSIWFDRFSRPPSSRSGMAPRIIVLIIVAVVVVAGGVWEFGFNIPGYKSALSSLEEISNSGGETPKTRADVLGVIGTRTPETKLSKFEFQNEDGKTIRFQRKDLYKWSRLIPGRKALAVIVTYERLVPESEAEGGAESVTDDQWVFKSFYDPENAPQDVTVQVKRKPKATAIFEFLDEDVDGIIVSSEIPGGSNIPEMMDKFDPNSDGKISFEEFTAAIEEMEQDGPLTREEEYALVGGESPGAGPGGPSPGSGGGGPGGGGPGGGGPAGFQGNKGDSPKDDGGKGKASSESKENQSTPEPKQQ